MNKANPKGVTYEKNRFDNDSIKKNILQAALPMLAAQILSLLYNIVDRIYIARIPIWEPLHSVLWGFAFLL